MKQPNEVTLKPQVTRDDALRFLGHAFRNINVGGISAAGLEEIRDGLEYFIRQRTEAKAEPSGGVVEADYSEQALADCQIDFLEARADEWMEETGVQRMFNALASVFEKYAPQDHMDRFRQGMSNIGRQCHVEGALRAWQEIAAQQRALGKPLPTSSDEALQPKAEANKLREAWQPIENYPKDTRGRPTEAVRDDRFLLVIAPELLDEDFNPTGIGQAHWQDGGTIEEPVEPGAWVAPKWCNCHDEYHLRVVNPTHYALVAPLAQIDTLLGDKP